MASMVERMIGAARLDPATYEEVEHDLNGTGQAALVVLIVAVAGGIGQLPRGHVGGLIFGIAGALIGWVLWAALTYFFGKNLFATPNTEVTLGQMLRTLGYAQSPGVLNIFAFIPILGGLISFVAGIWILVAGIIAIRQAMDFSTGRAIATALVSAIVPIIVIVFFTVFAVLAFHVA